MAKHPPRRRPKSEDSPKPPRHRLAEIQAEIHDVQQQIEQLRRAARVIRDAQDVRAWERQIIDLTDRLSGLLLAEAMQRASDHPENIQKARSLTQGAGHTLKDQGRRDVTLRTACGVVVVRVPYFSRNCDRARSGRGMYPILLLWGMHDRCTAALASEVSKLVAMLGSFETVEGRRVVLSVDGGRLRIRTTQRGPKTAKGRNRYRTDWREPKLLIIYVVNEQGQMDRDVLSVIDGTLDGPDAIFKLMEFYLRELGITKADQILFVADGARWIWNRVGTMLRRLGVKPDRIEAVVDFYHAVEHLGKIAALQRRWTGPERQKWTRRQRRRLLKGQVAEVQAAIDEVCGPRASQALKRERNYFKRNAGQKRMDYARLAALKLPIGSGAIESTIRRVVNLRLKGASIYWHKESAEAVLLLRSYYKAERWEHLEEQALTISIGTAA